MFHRREVVSFLAVLTISMLVLSMMIGSLSNGDDSDKETLFAQLWLFCDFLILFAFLNAGEERNSSIGVRAAEFNTEN